MKKIFPIVVFCLFARISQSQNDLDVMRYTQTGINGDARFMAMGGSFGALGANLSCANFNPAGLAVYTKNAFNVTGDLRFAHVDATH